MPDTVGVSIVSDNSTPEASSGMATPSANSFIKTGTSSGANLQRNENAEDSDDSWSVIYSSDDSNSINDVESKLTESSSENNVEENRGAINIDEDIDDANANHSIATISNVGHNKDDGTASITTLRKDSSEPWNGSLSIPKLSIKESLPAEVNPKLEATSSNEENDWCQKLERSGAILSKYLQERFHQVTTFISKQKRENNWIKDIPYLDSVGSKHLFLLALVIGFTIHSLSGLKNTAAEVGFLETHSPSYNPLIPPSANYLMCESSRSLAVIDRDPVTLSVDRVFFFGVSPEDGERYMKSLEGFNECMLPLSANPSIEALNAAHQQFIKLKEFLNQYCGEGRVTANLLFGSNNKGSVVYLSSSGAGTSAKVQKFADNLPDIPIRIIKEYTQTDSFIIVERKSFADILKQNLQQLKEAVNSPAIMEIPLRLKESVKTQRFDDFFDSLKIQAIQKSRDLYDLSQGFIVPVWQDLIEEAKGFDASYFLKLQTDIRNRGYKVSQAGLVGAMKVKNSAQDAYLKITDKYQDTKPLLKNYQRQAQQNSRRAFELATELMQQRVKPAVSAGFISLQEKAILSGVILKNGFLRAKAEFQEVLLSGKIIANSFYLQLREYLGTEGKMAATNGLEIFKNSAIAASTYYTRFERGLLELFT